MGHRAVVALLVLTLALAAGSASALPDDHQGISADAGPTDGGDVPADAPRNLSQVPGNATSAPPDAAGDPPGPPDHAPPRDGAGTTSPAGPGSERGAQADRDTASPHEGSRAQRAGPAAGSPGGHGPPASEAPGTAPDPDPPGSPPTADVGIPDAPDEPAAPSAGAPAPDPASDEAAPSDATPTTPPRPDGPTVPATPIDLPEAAVVGGGTAGPGQAPSAGDLLDPISPPTSDPLEDASDGEREADAASAEVLEVRVVEDVRARVLPGAGGGEPAEPPAWTDADLGSPGDDGVPGDEPAWVTEARRSPDVTTTGGSLLRTAPVWAGPLALLLGGARLLARRPGAERMVDERHPEEETVGTDEAAPVRFELVDAPPEPSEPPADPPSAPEPDPVPPGIPGILLMGQRAIERGDHEGALRWFETVVRIDPHLAVAHTCVGLSLLGMDRVPEAVDALERALELDAADPSARYQLARARAKLGDRAGAVEELARLRGDVDDLRRAVAEDGAFDEVRDDPRFLTLVGELPGPGDRSDGVDPGSMVHLR